MDGELTDDVARVEQSCRSFLETYFGTHHGAGSPEDVNIRQLGLRLVCLGNPERTVQGELVHYLRSHGLMAVSECGVLGEGEIEDEKRKRYSIDIVVFDDRWSEVCAIELKHYSANQGAISGLSGGMRDDVKRHGDVPVIVEN